MTALDKLIDRHPRWTVEASECLAHQFSEELGVFVTVQYWLIQARWDGSPCWVQVVSDDWRKALRAMRRRLEKWEVEMICRELEAAGYDE
jgi:hypothetical protein